MKCNALQRFGSLYPRATFLKRLPKLLKCERETDKQSLVVFVLQFLEKTLYNLSRFFFKLKTLSRYTKNQRRIYATACLSALHENVITHFDASAMQNKIRQYFTTQSSMFHQNFHFPSLKYSRTHIFDNIVNSTPRANPT